LLFEVANQHPPFRHKLGAVAHKADTFQFGINGVTQFAGNVWSSRMTLMLFRRGSYLSSTSERVFISSWRSRHPLQDFGHIRQTVVRQMRQRPGTAVENALHIVQHRQNHLVLLVDLMEIEATGEVTVSISYSEGVLCP
jgi:hypothetical protein